jgi:hypothetical protein
LSVLRTIRHNCSDDGRKEWEKRKLLLAPGIDRYHFLYNEKACDCGLDLKLATERLRGVDGWFDDRICDVVTRYQNMGMDIRLFLQVSIISILLLCYITNRNKEPKSYFDTRP